jgi:hypothetical protein
MADWRRATAEAVSPLLDNFQQIETQVLRSVFRLTDDECVARITLRFDRSYLAIGARSDDDTVELETGGFAGVPTQGLDASGSELWKDLIGKPFGWGWVTINQQGYCDGVLLSFDGIIPQVLLTVVASSIDERQVG